MSPRRIIGGHSRRIVCIVRESSRQMGRVSECGRAGRPEAGLFIGQAWRSSQLAMLLALSPA